MRNVTGILLAAGSSRRFGSNKLLAPLVDGTPLGVAAARCLAAALPEVTAIVQFGDRELADCFVAEGVRVVECADARQGIGRSLACGVKATAMADAWLVALADMPGIRISTVQQVARALATGAALAAPYHAGRRGHPVGFSALFRDALLGLSTDSGGHAILMEHATELTRVEVDDPGILVDVDTPAALRSLPFTK